MKKNYEIKVKLNKEEMPKFKNFLSSIVTDDISPEMTEALRDILLYQNLSPGQKKDWATFKSSHAGIFSEAILDNIQKKYIDFARGDETYVEVKSTKKGQEVVIKGKISEEATKEINISPGAVLNLVSGLTPTKSKSILKRSIDKAGLNDQE